MLIHAVFDVAAWIAAFLAGLWVVRQPGVRFPVEAARRPSYFAALVFGAGVGAVLFGTLNLRLSGLPGFARSVEGAIAGAILAVEAYKAFTGLRAATGARFALPLAVGVGVGRIGCHFAGLEDFTHGIPTLLPWGHDFGDGIARHPVQLYEAGVMLAFAAVYAVRVARGDAWLARNGLPVVLIVYAVQRFGWEFLKPYGSLLGPLTIFHILSVVIVCYGVVLLALRSAPAAVTR